MAKVFVDITPLRRYPAFRRLWAGNAVSQIGSQLSVVAVALEVYNLTHSDLDVGLISLVQLVPALFGSVVGGAIADAMDRRKLLVFTSSVMALFAMGMALEVGRHHPSVLVLYALAGGAAMFQGVNGPASTAVMISIVERDVMVQANALRQLSNQISSVLGPALAGIMIAAFGGTRIVFWANAGSFLFAIAAVLSVGARPPQGGATRFGWKSITEGFAFLRGRQVMQGTFIADLNATILGMPTALFPAMASTHFHGGPRTVGLLYAAPGIGAAIGASLSGWTSRIRRPGYAVCVAVACWGVALAIFGLAPWTIVAIACLAIAGGADMISAIFRSTIIQVEAPDRLRGRLTSIQMAVVQSGPRLGNTEAGLVAAATSTQFSVVSGGIGCVIGIALVAKLMPRFVGYELPPAGVVIGGEAGAPEAPEEAPPVPAG